MSEELDGKELHGVAWRRLRPRAGRICCFLYIVDKELTHLPSIYMCGTMLILKGWCFD